MDKASSLHINKMNFRRAVCMFLELSFILNLQDFTPSFSSTGLPFLFLPVRITIVSPSAPSHLLFPLPRKHTSDLSG